MELECAIKKLDNQRRILLSSKIRKEFPINKGQKLTLELDEKDNRIIITKTENDSENGSDACVNA